MHAVRMPQLTIDGVVLDHVAHAVPRWRDVWERYAVDLGALWASGGPGPGFAPAQLRFANSARIEVLRPCNTEVNDFLARFIDRNGAGPHHLTFKVPDLDRALDRVERSGFEPINIDRSDPEWLEAFIHPKGATGVVVQLAQQGSSWSSPPPAHFPTGHRLGRDGTPLPPASLVCVVHAVADLEGARGLFADLLGGVPVAEGSADDVASVDLAWPGPLGVRLVGPARPGVLPPGPLADWLGGRSGRIHHLELTAPEPSSVRGARPLSEVAMLGGASGASGAPGASGAAGAPTGCFEVPPEENFGLGLLLRPV